MKKFFNNTFFILIAFMIIGGLLGIIYNYELEWDFYNHRYYNAWAFLNGRMNIDIMPTLFRAYFNPLLDSLNYILMQKLNAYPNLFLFISGLKFGLFLFLSYLIFDLVVESKNKYKSIIVISSVVLTALSPIILIIRGYEYTDMQPACLIMFSLYLFIKNIYIEHSGKKLWWLFFSAFLTGCATGLKYTSAIFGVTLVAAAIFNYKSIQKPVKLIFVMLFGMLLGLLITDGFWMYTLWTHFHNPFFPYFNAFFNSSLDTTKGIFTNDFAHLHPKDLFHFILYPLRRTRLGDVGFEFSFFDLKLQLGFVAIIAYTIIHQIQKYKDNVSEYVKTDKFNIMIFISVFAYYSSLFLFSQYRYISPIFCFLSLIILVTYCIMLDIFQSKFDIQNTILLLISIFCLMDWPFANLGDMFVLGIIFFAFYLFLLLSHLIGTTKSSEKNKINTIQAGISLIMVIVLYSYSYAKAPVEPFQFGQIVKTKSTNFNIKDNSNVIVGTPKTSYVIPAQNPNAIYIGFAIPKDVNNNGSQSDRFRNMYPHNEYMESKLKTIFKENKDLYFIYDEEFYETDDDITMLNNSLAYYSDNKITTLEDCAVHKIYSLFLNDANLNEAYICKLK